MASGDKINLATLEQLNAHKNSTNNPHGVTAAQAGAVPTTRKVNNKALSGDIALNIDDISGGYAEYAPYVYPGVDLTTAFASEIAAAGNVWVWIKARIQSANFKGIHVGDYIPFTTTDNKTIKAVVAGIDTYYKFNDSQLGHHIDFISKDLWPDLHVWNKVNNNNGSYASPYPWLNSDLYAYLNSLSMNVINTTGAASSGSGLIAVNYTSSGVLDKLPTALKNVIVTKRTLLNQRYNASGVLTDDNSWGWADMGKLWVPSETEVYGACVWGTKGYSQAAYVQYPIFRNSANRIKGLGNGGSRNNWWLVSSSSGNSTDVAYVNSYGYATYTGASATWVGAPVCFRIA